MKVDPRAWLPHAARPLLGAVALVIALALALGGVSQGWFFVAWAAFDQARYWIAVREHFWHGNVNGGLVIGTAPVRIAVWTDLTRAAVSHPALKVLEVPRLRVLGRAPRVGDRVATVATYTAVPSLLTRWADFLPIPVELATRDPAVVARVLATLPDAEWAVLDAALAQLPSPPPLGLHLLDPARLPAFDEDD